MLKTSFCRILCALILALPVAADAAQNSPSPLVTAAEDLVRQTLSGSGSPSALAVEFQNVSSLPAESKEAAQAAIFNAFRNAGVRVVRPEQALVAVQIIFSEDWQGYLWIAVVHEGSTSQTFMKRVPRPERVVARAPVLTVRKATVWQQDDPILDFYTDNQNLVLLEPDQISLYTNDAGQWRGRYTLAISHELPWPRDLRGRLRVNGGQISAFLPGTLCTGSLAPPTLECHSSDDPWPIDQEQIVAFYTPRRNFFTGILSGAGAGASVLPFFSGVTWPAGDQRQWLFAGVDGRSRLYQNDLSTPAAVFNSWGAGLAGVHSNCGSGWQVLITAATDSVHPDSIQAVEISGREAQPVSSSIDLAGPVLSLWTSGKNGEAASGVTQSTVTGRYEAFTLTVTCN
jgi:hypothetical protein